MLGMARRTAGVLVALIGIAFVLSAIFGHLFTAAPAFERLTDGFRPAMEAGSMATLNADLTGLQAVSDEFGPWPCPSSPRRSR